MSLKQDKEFIPLRCMNIGSTKFRKSAEKLRLLYKYYTVIVATPIFVTTSRFTKCAIAEKRRRGVQLINSHALMKLIN